MDHSGRQLRCLCIVLTHGYIRGPQTWHGHFSGKTGHLTLTISGQGWFLSPILIGCYYLREHNRQDSTSTIPGDVLLDEYKVKYTDCSTSSVLMADDGLWVVFGVWREDNFYYVFRSFRCFALLPNPDYVFVSWAADSCVNIVIHEPVLGMT